MNAPRPRLRGGIALTVILAAGISPYLFVLPIWPHSRDATVWIARGAVSNPGWVDWVFATRHFNVGFRPVTAISYTLDNVLGGFHATVYRATDLGLHLGCAVMIFLLYRRLAPHLPRWGGLAAAAFFLAHPVTEQVVPHLARRSYSLATALSLAALIILCPVASGRPFRRVRWSRSLLGGLLVSLGLLANEVALPTVAVLPLLVLLGDDTGESRSRRWLSVALVPAAFVMVALVLRWTVVAGGVGGYVADVDRAARFVPILLATWRTLGAAAGAEGAGRVVAVAGLSLVTIFYVWNALRPVTGVEDRATQRLLRMLLLWLAGYVVLYALLGVWFPRQVYIVLVPLALLVGALLPATVRRFGARRALVLNLLPQLLLLGWVLFESPVLRGVDPLRAAAWRATDRVLRQMHSAIAELPDLASVRFAVPYFKRKPPRLAFGARQRGDRPAMPSRQAELWMRTLFAGRALQIESYLMYERDPLRPAPPPVLVADDPRLELVLSPEQEFSSEAAPGSVERTPEAVIVRVDAPATHAPAYFYFDDGVGGTMLRLDALRSDS